MAWTSRPYTPEESALHYGNKPALLGQNWMRHDYDDSVYTHRWNLTGDFTGADLSATGYELSKWAGDNGSQIITKPNASNTAWYIVLNWENGQDFDSIMLVNHNFNTALWNTQLTFQVDNAFNFPSPTTIGTYSVVTGRRVVELFPTVYENVEYMRILVATSVAAVPQFGELIIGQRRLLKHQPQDPWDSKHLVTDRAMSATNSGVVTTYPYKRGQRFVNMNIYPYETSYIDDIVDFYEADTDFGTLPFVLFQSPVSLVQRSAYWLMQDPPELIGPYEGPVQRRFNIRALEMGPHFISLES